MCSANKTRASIVLAVACILLAFSLTGFMIYEGHLKSDCTPQRLQIVSSIPATCYTDDSCKGTEACTVWKVKYCQDDSVDPAVCTGEDACAAVMCQKCALTEKASIVNGHSKIEPGAIIVVGCVPHECAADVTNPKQDQVSCEAGGISPKTFGDVSIYDDASTEESQMILAVSATTVAVSLLLMCTSLADWRRAHRDAADYSEFAEQLEATEQAGVADPRQLQFYKRVMAGLTIIAFSFTALAGYLGWLTFTACERTTSVADGGVSQFFIGSVFVGVLLMTPSCISEQIPTPRETWYMLNPEALQRRNALRRKAKEEHVPYEEPDEPRTPFHAPALLTFLCYTGALATLLLAIAMLAGYASCPGGAVSLGMLVFGVAWLITISYAWAYGNLHRAGRAVKYILAAIAAVLIVTLIAMAMAESDGSSSDCKGGDCGGSAGGCTDCDRGCNCCIYQSRYDTSDDCCCICCCDDSTNSTTTQNTFVPVGNGSMRGQYEAMENEKGARRRGPRSGAVNPDYDSAHESEEDLEKKPFLTSSKR